MHIHNRGKLKYKLPFPIPESSECPAGRHKAGWGFIDSFKQNFLSTAVQNCTNGTLRLVDGPVQSAGRLEVCINEVWGTVCDTRYYYYYYYEDYNVARVVCRQLGYDVNPGRGELVQNL